MSGERFEFTVGGDFSPAQRAADDFAAHMQSIIARLDASVAGANVAPAPTGVIGPAATPGYMLAGVLGGVIGPAEAEIAAVMVDELRARRESVLRLIRNSRFDDEIAAVYTQQIATATSIEEILAARLGVEAELLAGGRALRSEQVAQAAAATARVTAAAGAVGALAAGDFDGRLQEMLGRVEAATAATIAPKFAFASTRLPETSAVGAGGGPASGAEAAAAFEAQRQVMVAQLKAATAATSGLAEAMVAANSDSELAVGFLRAWLTELEPLPLRTRNLQVAIAEAQGGVLPAFRATTSLSEALIQANSNSELAVGFLRDWAAETEELPARTRTLKLAIVEAQGGLIPAAVATRTLSDAILEAQGGSQLAVDFLRQWDAELEPLPLRTRGLQVAIAEVEGGLIPATAATRTLSDLILEANGESQAVVDVLRQWLGAAEETVAAQREAAASVAGGGAAGLGGLGGLGGGGLGSVVAFTAAATVGFRGFSLIRDSIQQAEQLDQMLASIQTQANAIGQGQGFGALRQSILNTSTATGVAGTQVATLAQEFLGLYGNAAQAGEATRATAEIIRTTGVDAATAAPQVAALAEDLGVSAREIGNALIDIQDKTGRTGKDALAALSLLSPVASELGFTFDQTRGLIEATAEATARSGQSIGDLLSRFLPQLQTAIPKFIGAGIQFSPEALSGGQGSAAAVLQDVLSQYSRLSSAQQQLVVAAGGPRQANILASLLVNKQALADFNSTLDNNNLLADRNAAMQDTLKGAVDRFKTALVALGDGILHSGLTNFLKDVVQLATLVLDPITHLVSVFDSLNKALGGIPGTLITVVLALKSVEAIANSGLLAKIGALGLGGGAAAGAAEAGPVAGAFGGPQLEAGLAEGGLLALNPVFDIAGALAVVGGFAVKRDLDHYKQQIEDYRTNLQGKLAEDLNNQIGDAAKQVAADIASKQTSTDLSIDPGKPSNAEKVGSFLTGHPTHYDIFKGAQALKNPANQQYVQEAEALQAVDQDGVLLSSSDALKGGVRDKITQAVKYGQGLDQKTIGAIYDSFIAHNKKVGPLLQEALKSIQSSASTSQNTAQVEAATQTVDQVKAQYDIGQASFQDYVTALVNQINTERQLTDPQAQAKTASDLQKLSSAVTQQATEARRLQASMLELSGASKEQIDHANIDSLRVELQNPHLTTTDRVKVAQELAQAEAQLLKDMASDAHDVVTARQILATGAQLDPQTRELLLQGEVEASPDFSAALEIDAATINKYFGSTDWLIQQAVATNKSIREIIISGLQTVVTHLQERLLIDLALFNLPEFLQLESELATVQKTINDFAAQSQVPTTPGATVTLNADQAGGASNPNAVRDEQVAYNKAYANRLEALSGDNPISVALDKIQQDQDDINASVGDDIKAQTARLNAQADQIRQQHGLAKAFEDLYDSQMTLAEAIANQAGDVIKVAQEKATQAQHDFDALQKQGIGPQDPRYAQAQAAAVDAQTSLMDTRSQEAQKRLQDEYTLGQISAAQYVAQLRALEGVARGEDARRALEVQIHQILNAANNLQFNLPSDISLPTLYQARRLNQTPSGAGYADNRQINITLNAYNNTDVTAATRTILNAVSGSPSRTFGTATAPI